MTDGRLAGWAFGGAFLIRLTAWMGAAIFGTDGCHYLLMADRLGAGRFHDALSIAYHPMYPLLTAMGRIPLQDTALAAGLVSITLGAAAVFPLFLLVRAVFGRAEAFVAALLYAFNPSLIDVQSDVMTEGTFSFFFLSAMALTWRILEEPAPSRAVVLGLAAAAAYLTRPEGVLAAVLAVAWPIVELARRRDRVASRTAAVALTLVALVLAASPYLLWIRSVKGHWDLSMRPSVTAAEQAVGLIPAEGDVAVGSAYPLFFKSLLRLTYLVTIPFYLIGFATLGRLRPFAALFYFSFPAGYFAGLLYALRRHSFMTWRYVTLPMTLMMAVAAVGLVVVLRAMHRRWPQASWRPAALLLCVAALPCVRWLAPSRWECRSYVTAAAWIRNHPPVPEAFSGPVQQVAYLAGGRSFYSAGTCDGIRAQIGRDRVGWYVYTEKDQEMRPGWWDMVRSCDALEPPVEIQGPPGTWKVYLQRAR